jgi:predicted nucleotidyltransferase
MKKNDTGLSNEVTRIIAAAIAAHNNVTRAIIFGSRAKGNYRKYSDIDICLYGDISATEAQNITGELEELNLIYDFDVVAYNEIASDALRDHINRVGVEFYNASPGSGA